MYNRPSCIGDDTITRYEATFGYREKNMIYDPKELELDSIGIIVICHVIIKSHEYVVGQNKTKLCCRKVCWQ